MFSIFAEIIVFWKVLPIEEEQEDGEKITKQIPLLRYINVFHISQVDGVEPLPQDELHDIEPIEKAETEYSEADYTISPVIGNRWLCNLLLPTEVWQM